jgi:hypothetical protein
VKRPCVRACAEELDAWHIFAGFGMDDAPAYVSIR